MYIESLDHDSQPRRRAEALDDQCIAFAERFTEGKLDTDRHALEWAGDVVCGLMEDDEFCKAAVRALIASDDPVLEEALYKAAYDHERGEIEG